MKEFEVFNFLPIHKALPSKNPQSLLGRLSMEAKKHVCGKLDPPVCHFFIAKFSICSIIQLVLGVRYPLSDRRQREGAGSPAHSLFLFLVYCL